MIIKAISDTHNDHHHLDSKDLDCDVLIHCGDFGTKGNYGEAVRFFNWFVKQPSKYKIVVPGNHDSRSKTHPELLRLAYDYGIHFLMNESVEINDTLFHGCHYVPRVKDGEYVNDVEYRKEMWSSIPRGTSVLITHAPAYGILDTNIDNVHLGCDQLLEKINEYEIPYHFFGHLHEHAGKIVDTEFTTHYNCCQKNRLYTTTRFKSQEVNI